MKLRHGSLKLTLLAKLYWMNTALKSDVMRWCVIQTNLDKEGEWDKAQATKAVKALLKDGYITEYTLELVKDKPTVLTITKQGRTALVNKLNNELYETTERNYTQNKEFTTQQINKIENALSQNRLLSIFDAIGKEALPSTDTKPSLPQLLHALEHRKTSTLDDEDADILERFDNGFYYTAQEYKEGFKQENMNDEDIDAFSSSRFKGIYISNRQCMLIYDTTQNNKRNKVTNTVEQRLIEHIRNNFALTTDIFRELPRRNKNGTYQRNGVEAIVFTRGTAVITEMISGYKNGRITKRSYEQQRGKDKPAYNKSIIGADMEIFSRIYAIPLTERGMKSLMFITEHTIEEYFEYVNDLLENQTDYVRYSNEPMSGYRKKWNTVTQKEYTKAIVLPAYETKIIAALTDEETIITHADMIKTIAHGCMTRHEYVDLDSNGLDVFASDIAMDYTKWGTAKGYEVIEQALAIRNYDSSIVFTPTVKKELPLRMGYDNKNEFYNKVGSGQISLEAVILKITENQEQTGRKKEYHKTKKKTIGLAVSGEFNELVKKAAKLQQKSVNRYIIGLIKEQVEHDAAKYDIKLKEQKKGHE